MLFVNGFKNPPAIVWWLAGNSPSHGDFPSLDSQRLIP